MEEVIAKALAKNGYLTRAELIYKCQISVPIFDSLIFEQALMALCLRGEVEVQTSMFGDPDKYRLVV